MKKIQKRLLEVALGPARVIRIPNPVPITREELQRHSIQTGERILLRTANSDRHPESLSEPYVSIGRDAAEYLITCGVLIVGIDSPSIGGPDDTEQEIYCRLQDAGVWVIENLDLSALDPGGYEFICLPTRLNGSRRPVYGQPMKPMIKKAGA